LLRGLPCRHEYLRIAPPDEAQLMAQSPVITPHSPFFHDDSASVRFWVLVGDVLVGASITKTTLHYRYKALRTDDDALATYLEHAAEIDAAVRRRVAAGSREPVMLRDSDVPAPPGLPAAGRVPDNAAEPPA
jgi:Protein of unknown function (DUF1488)